MAANYNDGLMYGVDEIPVQLFQPFEAVGLSANDSIMLNSVQSLIASCFSLLFAAIHYEYGEAVLIPQACMQEHMFPSEGFTRATGSGVGDCINSLCAPRSSNPDIGGIGVRLQEPSNLPPFL